MVAYFVCFVNFLDKKPEFHIVDSGWEVKSYNYLLTNADSLRKSLLFLRGIAQPELNRIAFKLSSFGKNCIGFPPFFISLFPFFILFSSCLYFARLKSRSSYKSIDSFKIDDFYGISIKII